MYKIGIRAIYQKDLRTAVVEARRNGFEVLEIHLSSPQFQPEKYSQRQLKDLAAFAKKQNIILQVHASLESSLLFLNSDLRRAAEVQLKKAVQFSKAIEARCITLHPGSVFGYHFADGTKIKNDDVYRKEYRRLFDDGLKFLNTLSFGSLLVCLENTDNFNLDYQKILEKHLSKKRIFLTWDIRKNFSYTSKEPKKDQLDFIRRNFKYVKNLHLSGLSGGHGTIGKNERQFIRFINLFKNSNPPIILEVLPLRQAIESKINLKCLIERQK